MDLVKSAGQIALLKRDEQSRAAFYDQIIKNGLAQSESRSTSSRNSRGQQ
jgi:hypothetical protein